VFSVQGKPVNRMPLSSTRSLDIVIFIVPSIYSLTSI